MEERQGKRNVEAEGLRNMVPKGMKNYNSKREDLEEEDQRQDERNVIL